MCWQHCIIWQVQILCVSFNCKMFWIFYCYVFNFHPKKFQVLICFWGYFAFFYGFWGYVTFDIQSTPTNLNTKNKLIILILKYEWISWKCKYLFKKNKFPAVKLNFTRLQFNNKRKSAAGKYIYTCIARRLTHEPNSEWIVGQLNVARVVQMVPAESQKQSRRFTVIIVLFAALEQYTYV